MTTHTVSNEPIDPRADSVMSENRKPGAKPAKIILDSDTAVSALADRIDMDPRVLTFALIIDRQLKACSGKLVEEPGEGWDYEVPEYQLRQVRDLAVDVEEKLYERRAFHHVDESDERTFIEHETVDLTARMAARALLIADAIRGL